MIGDLFSKYVVKHLLTLFRRNGVDGGVQLLLDKVNAVSDADLRDAACALARRSPVLCVRFGLALSEALLELDRKSLPSESVEAP